MQVSFQFNQYSKGLNNNSYNNKKKDLKYLDFSSKNLNSSNVNFNGISVSNIFSRAQKGKVNYLLERAGDYLGLEADELKKIPGIKKLERAKFFHFLTENFVSDCARKKQLLPENGRQIIENLYNRIEKPNNACFSILNNYRFSFEQKDAILALAMKDNVNSKVLENLLSLKSYRGHHLLYNPDDLVTILSSENTQKLVNNFDDFKSYILLNHNKDNFGKNLAMELAAKDLSFDPVVLNQNIDIMHKQLSSPVLQQLPANMLKKNDNPLALKLLNYDDSSMDNLVVKDRKISKEDLQFFNYILKSTNKDNFKIRSSFFRENFGFIDNKNSFDDVMLFFKKLDKDKNFKKVYELLASSRNSSMLKMPIKDLMFYIYSFGSDVVLKRFSNFSKIMEDGISRKLESDAILKTLSKNLNNRFYTTSNQIGMARDNEYNLIFSSMFMGKTKSKLQKLKDKFVYEFLPSFIGTGKEVPIKKVVLDSKSRKLLIKKEGQEIIKKRMHSKKDYTQDIKKYTKMGNALLGEMFNSVKETRAQARACGVKRPDYSNKDVIVLYSKINSKNKNLVKYLLNQRSQDGTRKFNIKEIISFVDDIEAKRPPRKTKKLN